MKKNAISGRIKIIAALIFPLTLIISDLSAGSQVDQDWSSPIAKIKKGVPSGTNCVQFTPSDDPDYENKIMSYITAIDADLSKKITILRVKSQPVVDYLFVNGKLYTMMENWGEVEQRKGKEIETRLTAQYGAPLVQQDKSFYIYSFHNDRTKVLFYLIKISESKSRCIVYYYTKQLFRILITE